MFNDLLDGIHSYVLAHKHIAKHRLWHYYLWPIALAIIVSVIGFQLGGTFITWLKELLFETLNLNPDTSTWGVVLDWMISILIRAFFFYINLTLSKYLTLILLSPILAIISEQTERKITGKTYPFDLLKFTQEVLRGIAIALRNLCLEFFLSIVLMIVSLFFPPVAPLTIAVSFCIGSYFYGFSFLDYNNERQGFGIKKSVALIRSRKAYSVGNGAVFSLLFMIPYLGGIFAPILGTVAAGIFYHTKMLPSKENDISISAD